MTLAQWQVTWLLGSGAQGKSHFLFLQPLPRVGNGHREEMVSEIRRLSSPSAPQTGDKDRRPQCRVMGPGLAHQSHGWRVLETQSPANR